MNIVIPICSNLTNRKLVVAFAGIGLLILVSSFFVYFAATELPGGMGALVMSFQPMLVMTMSWFY